MSNSKKFYNLLYVRIMVRNGVEGMARRGENIYKRKGSCYREQFFGVDTVHRSYLLIIRLCFIK